MERHAERKREERQKEIEIVKERSEEDESK